MPWRSPSRLRSEPGAAARQAPFAAGRLLTVMMLRGYYRPGAVGPCPIQIAAVRARRYAADLRIRWIGSPYYAVGGCLPCRVIRHSDVMWQNCRQKTKLGISVARYQMDWWGHNEKHGWVVLDRNIPCNQPGSRGDLLFFRFRDSTTFPVARGDWHEPQYMYAPNYLRGKPSEVVEEFESLQSGWPELKVEMQHQRQDAENEKRMAALEKLRDQAIAKHRLLLGRLGIPYQGVLEPSPKKSLRVTLCYSCGHALNNATNSECAVCGWIVCICGACGCGYS